MVKMNVVKLVVTPVLFVMMILAGCSKKTHPGITPGITPISGVSSHPSPANETATSKKTTIKKEEPKATFPKVITVNDSAATKSVDGRLYYDVMGHRYWRNYKDGKYYLFNKSMYSNPDFKPVH